MDIQVWGRKGRLGLMAIAFAMAFALAPSNDTTLAAVDAVSHPAAPVLDNEEVTVTGCVIKGDNGGYVLTSVVPASIDVANRTAQSGQPADTAGTSGAAPNGASRVIYWLEDFEDHARALPYTGRRVEIRGQLEGDVEKGGMEVEREGDWVTLTLEKDGEDDVVTRLPATILLSADSPVGTSGELREDDDIELNVNVRQLDVQEVRVVTGTCGK
jgi:hypothetical protein